MDRWIISATQNLIKYARHEMDNYHLYLVVRPLLTFLEKLSNWYVRLNRSRMKGEEGQLEQQRSLNVLFEVILNTSILMAPLTPFLPE
jgi:isoleucyl-tRNA synthetase